MCDCRWTGIKEVFLARSKIREVVKLPGHSGNPGIDTSLKKNMLAFHLLMYDFGTAAQLELLRQLTVGNINA